MSTLPLLPLNESTADEPLQIAEDEVKVSVPAIGEALMVTAEAAPEDSVHPPMVRRTLIEL